MSATRFVQFLSGKRLDWSLACVAIVISMLPVSALKPWTNDVARLVLVPFVPVTHLGMFLRERIRPPQAIFDPRSPETIALDNEVARLRLLYEQTRLSSAQLEQTIQALRAVSTRIGSANTTFVEAAVVALDPSRVGGVVQVNAGSRHGVIPGAPVFIEGDLFAGLISDEVGSFGAAVIPALRLPSIGCRLYPAEGSDPRVPVQNYPGAVLKPTGRGTWTADVASTGELSVGLVARVADDRLPRSALGTRIGRVVSVEPIEQVPLARRIEVAPIAGLSDVASVIIAIDRSQQ